MCIADGVIAILNLKNVGKVVADLITYSPNFFGFASIRTLLNVIGHEHRNLQFQQSHPYANM